MDVLNEIQAVDMEVAFAVPVGDRVLAVAAVSVRAGFKLAPKDVTEAVRALSADQRPDIVYVVDDIPRSSTFRPSTRAVQAAGRTEPDDRTWWYNRESEAYEILTKDLAAQLFAH